MVDALERIDEKHRRLTFMATRDGVTERHLYEVGFDGGEPRRITKRAGLHDIIVDHARRQYLDVFQSVDSPPSTTLRSLADGQLLKTLHEERDPRLDEIRLEPPELTTLKTADGTLLHAAIYRPPARYGPGPWPTMVSVYGGPHGQVVKNSWGMTADMRAQHLRSRGYLVFKLDNRGSARRGLAFEATLKHEMGGIELSDQVEGVRWLVKQGLADSSRVGIYGWSYGGYMAALALSRAPDMPDTAMVGSRRHSGLSESRRRSGEHAGASTSVTRHWLLGKRSTASRREGN